MGARTVLQLEPWVKPHWLNWAPKGGTGNLPLDQQPWPPCHIPIPVVPSVFVLLHGWLLAMSDLLNSQTTKVTHS